MTDLLDAAAAGLVGVAPVAGRKHVEILSVIVDPVLFDQVAVVFAEPVARFVIAQVEQVPGRLFRAFGPFGIEHPLLVFRSPLRTLHDALGFEPHHEFGAGLVHGVRYGFQPLGEAFPVDRPVARGVGPALAVPEIPGPGVPSGVEPENVGRQFEHRVAADHGDGPVGRQTRIFAAGLRVAVVESAAKRVEGAAVDLARMVRENEAAETVVSVHAVAAPEHQGDRGRADLLARIEV